MQAAQKLHPRGRQGEINNRRGRKERYVSIKQMVRVWNVSGKVSPNEFKVLMCLADHADDSGMCWPGLAGIAIKASIHKSAVSAAVKSLGIKGFVYTEHQYRADGSQTTNKYTLQLPQGALQPSRRGGYTSTEAGGYSCAEAYNHHIEPSVEPSIIYKMPQNTEVVKWWDMEIAIHDFAEVPKASDGPVMRLEYWGPFKKRAKEGMWEQRDKIAAEVAQFSDFVHKASWFNFGWLCGEKEGRSNWRKVVDGNYRKKRGKQKRGEISHVEKPAGQSYRKSEKLA